MRRHRDNRSRTLARRRAPRAPAKARPPPEALANSRRGSLLALEVHGDDVGAVLDRLGDASVILRFLMLLYRRFLRPGVELEREIDRRILEAGDSGEGDEQLGGSLVEREPDL